ncbi:MAG: ADP-ribosylglycohydrolase family protein [Candidatus Thorarchaeota archaeon]
MGIDYLDKFKGTLFGVAIGDTLGRPFEGLIRMRVHSQFTDFKEFIKSNKKLFYTYTDDTQLTLHTAQALIDGWGFKTDYLIREYVKWLDDPPIGPGFGCKSSIEKLAYGIDWKEAASKSGGNGTAMRVAPIALFYCKDPKKLEHAVIQSSVITHSHPAASAGALVVAKAIVYLIDKEPETEFSVDDFFDYIKTPLTHSQEDIWQDFMEILISVKKNISMPIEAGLIKFSQAGVKSPFFIEEYLGKAFVHPYAISTVACAIFIFLKYLTSFEDCIYELATAGGDSDTVAAIGGSLAGSYFGLKKIPVELINLTKESQKTMDISEELFKRFKKKYM